ncbi:phosphomannomutase/phosphoglucomutase [Psychrobacter sp. I-STPA6b]|uniref:phosphomannomutase/phosphoglucomutase n=1 Tax=Psychrobacter sp. I-STPA6b TaxID=2585718 RepID=UPI001D0CBE93|nr:phosphomannomutase/phosphoglucomutase [Psychrobacter sp. I-STPA6b]
MCRTITTTDNKTIKHPSISIQSNNTQVKKNTARNSPYDFRQQQRLFRAYDIRGDYQYFTDEFVYYLAQTFAQLFAKHCAKQVVIGYDVRYGSLDIAHQLASALQQQNIEVLWLGLVTTPIMAYWAEQYSGHGLMVTASHSAKDVHGIKWLVAGESPSSADIQALYQQLLQLAQQDTLTKYPTLNSAKALKASPNNPNNNEIATRYITRIDNALKTINQPYNPTNNVDNTTSEKLPIRVVLDCLNGATSLYAQQLFEQFCQQVICLNDYPDGTFPLGNPDPAEENRLQQLQQAIIQHDADIGLAFDGDGDRLMVVDNTGRLIAPDHLLYLLAQVAIFESKHTKQFANSKQIPEVIFDVKCSHHLPKLITGLKAQPTMSRTGSSLMRKALQTGGSHAIFAGELSGHFLFNDGFFVLHDDAMYAGLRLLNWLTRKSQQSKQSLADIVDELPTMVSTADIYLPLPPSSTIQLSSPKQTKSTNNTNTKDHPLLIQLRQLCQQLCNSASSKSQQTDLSENILPKKTTLTCIDGIRLDFSHGFGIIRQSNTSHSFTVRFAGDTLDDLTKVQQYFVSLCHQFDPDFAKQIANICPTV